MAKRFTDTDKWKKPFIRSLQAPYKLLWFYILDDCDHAGIWHVDMEVASIRIGHSVDEKTALKNFGERVINFALGKWFIPDFIFFQYGQLTDKNRLHISVFNILDKYGIKGLISPLQGAKEQYKDKDKDKEHNKYKEIEKKYPIEDCKRIALFDERFTKANKTNDSELLLFNGYLERQGEYEFNPAEYKKYFGKLKGKYPTMLKKEYTVDELRELSKTMQL
jgi:hypothetical protein